jgi:hypothetical protein
MKGNYRSEIEEQVFNTLITDSHEHLIDEEERLNNSTPHFTCDDWSMLISQYNNFDLIASGMPNSLLEEFYSDKIDPLEKWDIIEPYWKNVKNTGYGIAVKKAVEILYGVDEIRKETIKDIQESYLKIKQRGYYKKIINDISGISSCQVNHPYEVFRVTDMPELFYQDIDVNGMLRIDINKVSTPTGIHVENIKDWLNVINWWFSKYGNTAVAVKCGMAYFRSLDFEKRSDKGMDKIFRKKIKKQDVSREENKCLEDYLFWFILDKAKENKLPIKLHMGFQALNNRMDMDHVRRNVADVAKLCALEKDQNFIMYHLSYPYYEEVIAAAKHYTNLYIDMCGAWTINPVTSFEFLKKCIVSVPINKIFTFGGDTNVVEQVVGHAVLARYGITNAISSLVNDNLLTLNEAKEIIEPLMFRNANIFFKL